MAPDKWSQAEGEVMTKLDRIEKGYDELTKAVNDMRVDFASFKMKNNILWGILSAIIAVVGSVVAQNYFGS